MIAMRIGWLAVAATIVLSPMADATALAQQATPEQRAEVRKLIRQRDRLHQKLEALDHQAADALKAGRDPVSIHAEQVNAQDELDLVQLRLEMLATRYGLPIPAVPGERDVRTEGDETEAEELERAIKESLSRGRDRAMAQIRADYERFLSSLDFTEFLGLDR